jgi:hypothetical protein
VVQIREEEVSLLKTAKDQEEFFLDVLEKIESGTFTWTQVAGEYSCSKTRIAQQFRKASRRFKMKNRIDIMLGVVVSKMQRHTDE